MVDVLSVPSADTVTIVFICTVEPVMTPPGYTLKHCSANSLPSADVEGNPVVSCHRSGSTAGRPPAESAHSPVLLSGMDVKGAFSAALYSSMYTGRALLGAEALGAVCAPSPTRTTSTDDER